MIEGRDPRVSETLLAARNLLRAGKVVEAAEACEKHLGLHGEDADVRFVLGAAARMAGRPDLALEHMRRAADKKPQTAQYWREIALTARDAGRPYEAADAARRHFALNSDDPTALEIYAKALPLVDKADQAADLVQKTLIASPYDPGVLTACANIYRTLERYDDAADLYRRLTEIDESDMAARYALSLCERLAGRPAAAAEAAQVVAGKRLLASEPWVVMGDAARETGDMDAALECYVEALERDAAQRDAHEGLVRLLLAQGREGDVRAHLAVMLDGAPESLPLKFLRVKTYREIGEIDKAEEAVVAALGEHGEVAELHDLAALIAFERGAFDLADERHQAAMGARPYDVAMVLNAARTALRREEFDKALRYSDYASRCDPTQQRAYAYGFLALKKLEKDDHAARLASPEDFVKAYDLEAPEGWPSVEGFLSDLAEALKAMAEERSGRDANLVRAVRTRGRLFSDPAPVIEALQLAIANLVRRHIDALPQEDGRAFLRRRPRAWRFNASCAYVWRSGGRLLDHVREGAWLSGHMFLDGAGEVGDADAEDVPGALRVGASPEELSLDLPPVQRVAAKAGRVVLFPSFLWRGTEPVESEARAVAFDVRPTA